MSRIAKGAVAAALALACASGAWAGEDKRPDDPESTEAEESGTEELCRIDREHCAQIDMDYYAKREVKAEIYAIQNYDNFGCASCSLGTARSGAGAWWLALGAALLLLRRR